jgi:Pyruvate/2-oxoacid:ferredoxin oxidoreductase gamma subunit
MSDNFAAKVADTNIAAATEAYAFVENQVQMRETSHAQAD